MLNWLAFSLILVGIIAAFVTSTELLVIPAGLVMAAGIMLFGWYYFRPNGQARVAGEYYYICYPKTGPPRLLYPQSTYPARSKVVKLWPVGAPVHVEVDSRSTYVTRDRQLIQCSLVLHCLFMPDLVDQACLPKLSKEWLENCPSKIREEVRAALICFFIDRSQQQIIAQGRQELRILLPDLITRCWGGYGLYVPPDFDGINLTLDFTSQYKSTLHTDAHARFNSAGLAGARPHWEDYKKQGGLRLRNMHFSELIRLCSVADVRFDELVQYGIRFEGVKIEDIRNERVRYQNVPSYELEEIYKVII